MGVISTLQHMVLKNHLTMMCTVLWRECKCTMVWRECKCTGVWRECKSTVVWRECKPTVVWRECKSTVVWRECKCTVVWRKCKSTVVWRECKSTVVWRKCKCIMHEQCLVLPHFPTVEKVFPLLSWEIFLYSATLPFLLFSFSSLKPQVPDEGQLLVLGLLMFNPIIVLSCVTVEPHYSVVMCYRGTPL